MDYGRWSERIFTKKPREQRKRRLRERQEVVTDKAKIKKSKFRSFVRNVFRGRVKV